MTNTDAATSPALCPEHASPLHVHSWESGYVAALICAASPLTDPCMTWADLDCDPGQSVLADADGRLWVQS